MTVIEHDAVIHPRAFNGHIAIDDILPHQVQRAIEGVAEAASALGMEFEHIAARHVIKAIDAERFLAAIAARHLHPWEGTRMRAEQSKRAGLFEHAGTHGNALNIGAVDVPAQHGAQAAAPRRAPVSGASSYCKS